MAPRVSWTGSSALAPARRRLLLGEVNAAIEGALTAGADEIVRQAGRAWPASGPDLRALIREMSQPVLLCCNPADSWRGAGPGWRPSAGGDGEDQRQYRGRSRLPGQLRRDGHRPPGLDPVVDQQHRAAWPGHGRAERAGHPQL